jgi:serine/threonine protein kinase
MSFIECALQCSPTKRSTCEELLEHEFLVKESLPYNLKNSVSYMLSKNIIHMAYNKKEITNQMNGMLERMSAKWE